MYLNSVLVFTMYDGHQLVMMFILACHIQLLQPIALIELITAFTKTDTTFCEIAAELSLAVSFIEKISP